METPQITLKERLANFERALGRKPALEELLKACVHHKMTPEERQAQRESWVRAGLPTGDPRFD